MLRARRVVVVPLCCVLAVATSAWPQGQPSVGPLPREALVLPADMGVLVGVDAAALFASDEFKALAAGQPLAGMPAGTETEAKEGIARGLKEFEANTGIAPERDLERLVVALGDFAATQPKFAVVATGRLDAARVSEAFGRSVPGATPERRTVAGRPMLVLAKGGKPDTALVFLGERALVFGTPAVVEAAASGHAEGRRSLYGNTALRDLVGRLDPAASLFVAVGSTATGAMRQASGPKPPPFPIPDALTLAARFGGGLEVVAEMPAEADARNLADVVRGGLAALRMRAGQDPQFVPTDELNRLLGAIEVTAEGKRARLGAPGPGGVAGVGIIAAIAIPSLLRARVAANEAAVIGDTRTVISAEMAYESAAGGYGDLACLAKPAACVRGYTGPAMLDETLAAAGDKTGYKRAFHPGPAGKKPRTYQAFAYTAVPIQAGNTGVRSFCGDATGRICFDPKGAPIVPVKGACPQTCTALQ